MIAQLESPSLVTAENPIANAPLAESPKSKVSFLDGLTVMRFWACLCIVLLHAEGMKLTHIMPDPRLPAALAQALPFFYAMSGFILSYNYKAMTTWAERGQYLLNRAARILPMYYIAGIACLFIPAHALTGAKYNHYTYFLLIQDWFKDPARQFPLDPAAHSMSTETFFYLIFAVLLSLKSRKFFPVIAVALAALTYFDCLQPIDTSFAVFPIIFCKYFLYGCLFERIYQKLATKLPQRNLTFVFTLLEIAALLLACYCSYQVAGPLPPGAGLWSIDGTVVRAFPILLLMHALSLNITLLVFAFERGLISRIFKNKLFIGLGLSSYILFLIHYPVETFLMISLTGYSDFDKTCITLTTILLMMAASIVVHRQSEEPWRRLICKIGKSKFEVTEWLKQSWRLALPVIVILAMGPAVLGVTANYKAAYKYLTTPTDEQIWKNYKYPVISYTRQVTFNGGDRLLGAKLAPGRTDAGDPCLRLETLWQAEKQMNDRGYLAVHMIDATNKIVHNLDRKITPPESLLNKPWLDSIEVPTSKYPTARALAIGIYRDGRGQLEDIKAPGAQLLYGKMLVIPLP